MLLLFLYSTFDYAKYDDDGYYFMLGRTDDVINVSGHRIGTREIEEVIQNYKNVVETTVVGVFDETKGQVPVAFIVPKENQLFNDHNKKNEETSKIKELINRQLGPFARPNKVYFVSLLPKTRSGKLLRRAIQAVLENKDAGDLTTLEDPSALEEIKRIIHE